jgi:hypothetical protein
VKERRKERLCKDAVSDSEYTVSNDRFIMNYDLKYLLKGELPHISDRGEGQKHKLPHLADSRCTQKRTIPHLADRRYQKKHNFLT